MRRRPSTSGTAAGRRAGAHPLPTEARRLLEPWPALGVPRPAYAGRSLPNVASSVARALGRELAAPALPPLERSLDPFRDRRATGPVLLFVVDGLGYLRSRAFVRGAGDPRRRAWLAGASPITTVFPTTTTVALVSLSTATAPARHGVVGYRQYLPKFGSVVDILRLAPLGVAAPDALVGPDWRPSDLLGTRTIFRRGIAGTTAISRDRFRGQGFTRAIYDGTGYEPYSAWADLAAALVKVLGRAAPPALTLAYWDELDTVQHLRGPDVPAVDLELDRFGELLAFVARELGPRRARAITVILTADHGLVPCEPSQQVALDAEPSIVRRLARPLGGDRRAGLLRARDGEVDSLEEALRRRLPRGTRILPAGDALREGLFGPPPFLPGLGEMIGDLVVLLPSPAGITYTVPGRRSAGRTLLGAHGGLEPEELLVPLVASSLSELVDRAD